MHLEGCCRGAVRVKWQPFSAAFRVFEVRFFSVGADGIAVLGPSCENSCYGVLFWGWAE